MVSVLLAVAVTICAVCIIILQARNNYLHRQLNDAVNALDRVENGEALAPPSHNVSDVDMEAIMTGSDDPVWDLVIDCRAVGIMNEWVNRHPEFANVPDHRKYGEFATFILNLPEHQRSVHGIRLAVTGNA